MTDTAKIGSNGSGVIDDIKGQNLDNAFYKLSPEDWKKALCFVYTKDEKVLKLLYEAICAYNAKQGSDYDTLKRAAEEAERLLDAAQNALAVCEADKKLVDEYKTLNSSLARMLSSLGSTINCLSDEKYRSVLPETKVDDLKLKFEGLLKQLKDKSLSQLTLEEIRNAITEIGKIISSLDRFIIPEASREDLSNSDYVDLMFALIGSLPQGDPTPNSDKDIAINSQFENQLGSGDIGGNLLEIDKIQEWIGPKGILLRVKDIISKKLKDLLTGEDINELRKAIPDKFTSSSGNMINDCLNGYPKDVIVGGETYIVYKYKKTYRGTDDSGYETCIREDIVTEIYKNGQKVKEEITKLHTPGTVATGKITYSYNPPENEDLLDDLPDPTPLVKDGEASEVSSEYITIERQKYEIKTYEQKYSASVSNKDGTKTLSRTDTEVRIFKCNDDGSKTEISSQIPETYTPGTVEGETRYTYDDDKLIDAVFRYANSLNADVKGKITSAVFNALNGNLNAEAIKAKKDIISLMDTENSLLRGRKSKYFELIDAVGATIQSETNSIKQSLEDLEKFKVKNPNVSDYINDLYGIYGATKGDIADLQKKIGDKIDNFKYKIPDGTEKTIDELKGLKNAANEALGTFLSDKDGDLLALALRYNPSDIVGRSKIASIKKVISKDESGNEKISYEAIEGGVIGANENLITVEDVTKHLNIPYFALAMCYEKSLIVQDQIAVQTDELKAVNEKIKENNKYLKKTMELYEEVYNLSIKNDSYYEVGVGVDRDLKDYLLKIGVKGESPTEPFSYTGTGSFENGSNPSRGQFHYGYYGKKGTDMIHEWNSSVADLNAHAGLRGKDVGGSKDYEDISNIDVVEQDHLTQVSNAQEAVRMKGDELSTEAQMIQTKLTQQTQNLTSFLSIASQICKSVGDYFRSVASNVR